VLVIGATSAIAEACARRLAARGARLYLIGRDDERLQLMVRDLALRGASVIASAAADLREHAAHARLLDDAWTHLGGVDAVLIAHGVLLDQATCETSVTALRDVFETNALSVMSLLTHLAPRLMAERRGTIAVVSSVAGDRGRASNYVYGASKAALDAFLSGLRNRLSSHSIRVVTVKPGFVDTPMTAAMRKGWLWASADDIARGIVRALDGGAEIVYLPWFWRPIMAVVRALPERYFKRMRL
jgi:short-subunit dehydrogenase